MSNAAKGARVQHESTRVKRGLVVTSRSVGGIPRAFGTLADRFWAKVYPDPICGCWLWAGDSGGRYGSITLYRDRKATRILAHRLSYEMNVGPIPNGQEIDHKCGNTHCVSPQHLQAVTHSENLKRIVRKPRRPKTHCKHGHEMTPENTVIRRKSTGNSYRVCGVCVQAWWGFANAKRRAAGGAA